MLPPILEDAWRAHPVIQWYEAYRALAYEYDNRRELIGHYMRDHLAEAASVTHDAYDAARRTMKRARQALAELMGDYAAILTPSAPGAAPHGWIHRSGDLQPAVDPDGHTGVNVPGLADGTGLPPGADRRPLRPRPGSVGGGAVCRAALARDQWPRPTTPPVTACGCIAAFRGAIQRDRRRNSTHCYGIQTPTEEPSAPQHVMHFGLAPQFDRLNRCATAREAART